MRASDRLRGVAAGGLGALGGVRRGADGAPIRPLLQDEYQFCYQAALEYLGSFDHYAT